MRLVQRLSRAQRRRTGTRHRPVQGTAVRTAARHRTRRALERPCASMHQPQLGLVTPTMSTTTSTTTMSSGYRPPPSRRGGIPLSRTTVRDCTGTAACCAGTAHVTQGNTSDVGHRDHHPRPGNQSFGHHPHRNYGHPAAGRDPAVVTPRHHPRGTDASRTRATQTRGRRSRLDPPLVLARVCAGQTRGGEPPWSAGVRISGVFIRISWLCPGGAPKDLGPAREDLGFGHYG